MAFTRGLPESPLYSGIGESAGRAGTVTGSQACPERQEQSCFGMVLKTGKEADGPVGRLLKLNSRHSLALPEARGPWAQTRHLPRSLQNGNKKPGISRSRTM